MRFHTIFLAFGALFSVALATNQNLGCSNCLGDNQDSLRYNCYQLCSKAFNSASHEYNSCRTTCNEFVFEKNCCTGTCSSDANTCMNTFWPPSYFKQRRGVYGHDTDDFSLESEANTGIAIRNDHGVDLEGISTALLEARVNYGSACCKAAQTVLASASTKIIPLIQGQTWDDDTATGLFIIAFGLAAAKACSVTFGVSCLFQANGANGPVAGGALPVPGI